MQWIIDNQAVILAIATLVLTGLVNVATRLKSREQWIALADSKPRLHAALTLLRAIGIDPVQAWDAVVALLTGRAIASQSALPASVQPIARVIVSKNAEKP